MPQTEMLPEEAAALADAQNMQATRGPELEAVAQSIVIALFREANDKPQPSADVISRLVRMYVASDAALVRAHKELIANREVMGLA